MTVVTSSEEETIALGRTIGEKLEGGELIALVGDLGSGKTRLVRGIAEGIGAGGDVSSPTFVIEHIYRGRITLVHIDLYRVEGSVSDLGIDDAIANRCAVVVEWGDRLPKEYVARTIRIETIDATTRRILDDENTPVP